MGFIHCCGALRKCRTYSLEPQDGYLLCELDLLEACPRCGAQVAQLTRVDFEHNTSCIRRQNAAALRFFQKFRSSILFEQKVKYGASNPQGGRFYLNYNEYGKKKRCYSNLSTLQIGKFDFYEGLTSNPIRSEPPFYKHTSIVS